MSARPVDVIAQAIRHADGGHSLGAGALAEVAANTLTDPTIVDNAVQALFDDRRAETRELGFGRGQLRRGDLTAIARTVLRSVGEGA